MVEVRCGLEEKVENNSFNEKKTVWKGCACHLFRYKIRRLRLSLGAVLAEISFLSEAYPFLTVLSAVLQPISRMVAGT